MNPYVTHDSYILLVKKPVDTYTVQGKSIDLYISRGMVAPHNSVKYTVSYDPTNLEYKRLIDCVVAYGETADGYSLAYLYLKGYGLELLRIMYPYLAV